MAERFNRLSRDPASRIPASDRREGDRDTAPSGSGHSQPQLREAIVCAIASAGALGPSELLEVLGGAGIHVDVGPRRRLLFGEFCIARDLPDPVARALAELINEGRIEVRLRPVASRAIGHSRAYAIADFALQGSKRFRVTRVVPPIPFVRYLAGEIGGARLSAGLR